MRLIFVDTNAFLRFLLNDIPQQKEAFERLIILAKQSKVSLFISQIVIFELYFILDKYYHFAREEIIDKLKSIIAVSYLEIQDKASFRNAIKLFNQNRNISFVDCFLLSKAELENAELFTFDKRLKIFKGV